MHRKARRRQGAAADLLILGGLKYVEQISLQGLITDELQSNNVRIHPAGILAACSKLDSKDLDQSGSSGHSVGLLTV